MAVGRGLTWRCAAYRPAEFHDRALRIAVFPVSILTLVASPPNLSLFSTTTPMIRTSLSVAVALILATGSFAQTQNQPAPSAPAPQAQPAAPAPKVEFPAPSPAATLKQRVGLTDIAIVYSRPSMRGRKIFGGLELYGEVWRTGANAATRITFSTPVKFGGVDLAAGAYEFFTIPGPTEWTIILQKLTDIRSKLDFLITLDTAQVRSLFKAANGYAPFIEKAYAVSTAHPDILPAVLNVGEFQKDFALIQALTPIRSR